MPNLQFPERVWEPTGKYTKAGSPMFASHPPTKEDRLRKVKFLAKFNKSN